MVNVLTGREDCACINATTILESIPPDKNAPSGTSAIICWRTASLANTSSASTASSAVPANGLATPARATSTASQYFQILGSGCANETDNRHPGSSLAMP